MQMNLVIFWILATFLSLAACESIFLRPPQWDPNYDVDRDLGRNIRYSDGEDIQIIFYTDEPNLELFVWQMNPASKKGVQHAFLNRDSRSWKAESNMGHYLRYGWKAKYDMGRYLRHGEDSVYWFGLYKSGDHQTPLAESQYVNVTIPDSVQHHTVTVVKTIIAVQKTAILQPPPQGTTIYHYATAESSAATEMPSSEEKKNQRILS